MSGQFLHYAAVTAVINACFFAEVKWMERFYNTALELQSPKTVHFATKNKDQALPIQSCHKVNKGP